MSHIHEDIINRYLAILAPLREQCVPDPGTELIHLKWMLNELPKIEDELKAHRWLGFIQGVLIMKGHLTVPEERDFTRPYFTKAKGEPSAT